MFCHPNDFFYSCHRISKLSYLFNIGLWSYHTDVESRLIKTKIEVQFAHKFWVEVASNSIALWLKWIEMEQIRTNTHGPFRSERSGAERSGAEREEEIKILKRKRFSISLHALTEWGMEWNGMEWNETERNRTKQNETEWNRTKQNETERNRMKQNEMDWNGTNQNKHTRTVPLWTERSGFISL